MSFSQVAFFMSLVVSCGGVTLYGCGDLPETSQVRMECADTGSTVFWYRSNSAVAECSNTSCTNEDGFNYLLATRPSATTSYLYVDGDGYKRWSTFRVSCGTYINSKYRYHSCYLRPVYHEEPSGCRFDVSQSSMMIHASCDVDKIYASDGKYVCRWQEVMEDQTQRMMTGSFVNFTSFTDSSNGLVYKQGVCDLIVPFFPVNGRFVYYHYPSPGSPVYVATLTIYGSTDMTLSAASFVTWSLETTTSTTSTTTTTASTSTSTTAPSSTPTTSTAATTITTTPVTMETSPTVTPPPTHSSTANPTSASGTDASTEDGEDPNVAAYVAGGVGAVLVIVVTILGVLILMKLSKRRRENDDVPSPPRFDLSVLPEARDSTYLHPTRPSYSYPRREVEMAAEHVYDYVPSSISSAYSSASSGYSKRSYYA